MDAELMKLQRAIRSMREFYGWSQEELAKQAKMDVSAISFVETGRRPPTFRTLARLAKAGNISVARLLALGDQKEGA